MHSTSMKMVNEFSGADLKIHSYDRWNDLASTMTIPNPLNPTGKEVNLRELNQVINSKAIKMI